MAIVSLALLACMLAHVLLWVDMLTACDAGLLWMKLEDRDVCKLSHGVACFVWRAGTCVRERAGAHARHLVENLCWLYCLHVVSWVDCALPCHVDCDLPWACLVVCAACGPTDLGTDIVEHTCAWTENTCMVSWTCLAWDVEFVAQHHASGNMSAREKLFLVFNVGSLMQWCCEMQTELMSVFSLPPLA